MLVSGFDDRVPGRLPRQTTHPGRERHDLFGGKGRVARLVGRARGEPVLENVNRQRKGAEKTKENERPADRAARGAGNMIRQQKAHTKPGSGAGAGNKREFWKGQYRLSHGSSP